MLKGPQGKIIVMLAMIAAQSQLRADMPRLGCAKDTSSVIISSIHVHAEDWLKTLVKLGSDYGVCLGIRTDAEKHPVSIDESNIHFADVVRRFFPSHHIDLQPSITIIQQKSRADWLEFPPEKSLYQFRFAQL